MKTWSALTVAQKIQVRGDEVQRAKANANWQARAATLENVGILALRSIPLQHLIASACNLFFRKNGRKRPASMRRDTISRRYRLSRCDLCAMEAQGGQTDFAQFQKAVARHRRNGKASAKAHVQQASEAPLPPPLPGNQTKPLLPSHHSSYLIRTFHRISHHSYRQTWTTITTIL
ncbi:hypothetical protein OSTOST_25468 [Ostertagia ostertagi]